MREGNAMFTVQDDWIEYETTPVPARRVAVRGGAACAQRVPVVREPRTGAAPLRAVGRPEVVRPAVAGGSRTAAVATRPAATASRPARLRLTRRGRVVLVVLPALLALSGALLAAAPGAAEAAPRTEPRAAVRTVVVGTGDTLWTIAERVAPHADPRGTVAALERANGLDGAVIQAGEVLVLPAG
jgi:nucleoid-associated protein YgaU